MTVSIPQSFVKLDPAEGWGLNNLPYGVFSTGSDDKTRPGVAIGDKILDLDALSRSSHFKDSPVPAEVFQGGNLDAFVAREPEDWAKFRAYLQKILGVDSPLKDASDLNKLLVDRASAKMHLPIRIDDYTDFYASYEHAFNCGCLIRGPDNAMQPNWKHLPVAYHGRASSVVISGTPFHRPVGQILEKPGDKQPIFAPCRRLDYELETGFIYGGPASKLGERLSPAEARKHIFGLVLLNDWSARDIQTWEYVPLGPFLSKNFCTTISPWIVQPVALEPFRAPQYDHDPELLPYLQDPEGYNYAVPLNIDIKPEGGEYDRVSVSSMQHTYYTFAQMIAHHSCTGCGIRPSDLMGSGTLSAPNDEGLGSLLERSRMGKQPFKLGKREDMTWLRDGDSVRISALVKNGDAAVNFGECEGTVLPPLKQFGQ